MTEQEGVWALTLQPRKWLRWLPIERIDDWLIERANFEPKSAGGLPIPPRWYHHWNSFAFCLDWEWEELESEMYYTPAPWKENQSPDGKETGITGPESEINEPVCIIPHDDVTEEGIEEVCGNTALITHAPKMFEALERAKKDFEMIPGQYSDDARVRIESLLNDIEKAADNG